MGLSCCGRHSSSGNFAVQCGPGAACGLLVLGNAMLRGAKLVLVPADLGWLAPSAIADNLSDFFFFLNTCIRHGQGFFLPSVNVSAACILQVHTNTR